MRDAGGMLSDDDMHQAAASLRKITVLTADLAGDSPTDAQLRERLELAADVLDAASEADR